MVVQWDVDVRGIKQIKQNLARQRKRIGAGVERGLIKAGQFLLDKSNEIAPIKDGTLIGDSFVAAAPKRGMDTVVHVVYGPDDSPSFWYAVVQHEKFEEKREPGRQWKYLETPLRRHRRTINKIIGQEVEKQIR